MGRVIYAHSVGSNFLGIDDCLAHEYADLRSKQGEKSRNLGEEDSQSAYLYYWTIP